MNPLAFCLQGDCFVIYSIFCQRRARVPSSNPDFECLLMGMPQFRLRRDSSRCSGKILQRYIPNINWDTIYKEGQNYKQELGKQAIITPDNQQGY